MFKYKCISVLLHISFRVPGILIETGNKILIKSLEDKKKAIVYKTLRVLLQITSFDLFQMCLQQTMQDLLDDTNTNTNTFDLYFKRHYARRPECWVYCYRLRHGINTNMYLESFHKTLRHIYLEGNNVKRLDKNN